MSESGKSYRRRKHKSSKHATSSFTSLVPSRASVVLQGRKEHPVWFAYLFGLLGVCILILFGGSHNSLALGVALLLPGVALILRPPKKSLGRWIDLGILGLLGSLLLAFIPQFYWPIPDWRALAVSTFEIDLPSVLSVQPIISLEAWLMAVAGFSWFYAASSWRINLSGRNLFFITLSCLIAVFAGIVIWANLHDLRYPGAEDSTTFSFFPNRNQTANFLVLGGVVGFAFAMEGLQGRRLLHLTGVVSSSLCAFALILGVSRAGLLLYFIGIMLWFISRLRAKSVPIFFKVGFPLCLLAFSIFITSNEKSVARVVDFVSAPTEWNQEYRSLLYHDTLKMIGDAPVAGFGVGNFSAVFPQYREQSKSFQQAVHPESDLFWLVAEGGLLALAFFGIFLGAYFVRCKGLSLGRAGSLRVIALIAVIIFVLHGLVDVSGHRPGTVYFAILFAGFALPRLGHGRKTLSPRIWRGLGGILIFCGSAWFLCGLTGLPLHSSTTLRWEQKKAKMSSDVGDYESAIRSMDKILLSRPLDGNAYFQRAQLILADSGRRGDAAADFRRARFVEPTMGEFTLKEGFVWLPYDVGRTLSAWRETLFRELENKDGAFLKMLDAGRKNPKLMQGLIGISSIDLHYRTQLLNYLRGEKFMIEVRKELAIDPSLSHFNREQRTGIVSHWVDYGDASAVEVYLESYASKVDDPWWLLSRLRKNQAQFEDALTYIREGLPVPEIPKVTLDEKTLARLTRSFAVMPQDLIKGTALLRVYLDRGDLEKALQVVDSLIQLRDLPSYIHYWRAEILYRMDDYIESWYAFEAYIKLLDTKD